MFCPQVEDAVRARLTIEKEALLLRQSNENYSQQVGSQEGAVLSVLGSGAATMRWS